MKKENSKLIGSVVWRSSKEDGIWMRDKYGNIGTIYDPKSWKSHYRTIRIVKINEKNA